MRSRNHHIAGSPWRPLGIGIDVRERDVANLDLIVPLVEQLDGANLLGNILGDDVGGDLDLHLLRHVGCCSRWFRRCRETAVSIARCRDGIFREVGGLGRQRRVWKFWWVSTGPIRRGKIFGTYPTCHKS